MHDRATTTPTRAIAIALLLVMLMTACSSSDADGDAADTGADETAEATDAADASGPDDAAAGTEECETGIETRFAHHLGDTVIGHEAFVAMGEEIEAETDGRITMEVFPAGQLGGIAEWAGLLRDGVIEFAWTDASTLGAVVPDVAAPNLPFLFENEEEFHQIMDGPIGEDINALIREEAGIEILGWSSVGALIPFFGGVEAATTPEDLQGLAIRVPEAPVSVEAWRLLGAEPVAMPLGDAYTALQTGAINAYWLPYWATRATSMYEVSDAMSELPVAYANLAIAVDPNFLSGLCEADQAAIRTAASNAEAANREGWPAADVSDREYLIEQGIEVAEVEDVDAFRQLVLPQWEEFEANATTDLFTRMRAELGR